MRRLLPIACLALPLWSCSESAEVRQEARSVATQTSGENLSAPGDRSTGRWLDHERAPNLYLPQMKEMIRRHAALIYGPECGTVRLPDAAFFPIEINGGLGPELAISFGYAECGAAPNSFFRGNVGIPVQFWTADGGRPRLLLETTIHGFTTGNQRLVTVQHGGACQVTGTDFCRVTYRWEEIARRLETAERKPFSALPPQPEPAYFGNILMGTGPCGPRQAALPADERRCGR